MTYKVELTLEELNLCLDGLGELTAKRTYHLINKLHSMYAEQSKPEIIKEEEKEEPIEGK